MRAGRLRFRLTVLCPVEEKNPMGGVKATSWTEVKTIWADIEPIRGEERHAAAQAKASADVKITTRANAAAGVTPKMRFRNAAACREYDIEANIDWRSRGIFREFYCKEVA